MEVASTFRTEQVFGFWLVESFWRVFSRDFWEKGLWLDAQIDLQEFLPRSHECKRFKTENDMPQILASWSKQSMTIKAP